MKIISPSTSSLIIDYLFVNGPATIAEISRALDLTKADIRYQVSNLVNSGAVIQGEASQSGHAGRPAMTFSLPSLSYPNNDRQLLTACLALIFSARPAKHSLIEALAGTLPSLPKGSSQTIQLNKVVSLLNSMNYKTSWEASKAGPRIIIQDCPYSYLIDRFPELCEVDYIYLTALVHSKIKRTQCIQGRNGRHRCVFEISK